MNTILQAILFTLIATNASAASANDADLRDQLAAKRDLYLELSKSTQDPNGFVVSRCDGLLFTSLYSYAGGIVDVAQAEDADKPGKWYRDALHTCYPDHSKSTISRDMILGLLYWIWKGRRVDKINSLVAYGEAHNWIMGEAVSPEVERTRTQMSGPLVGTIYELRYRLTGVDSEYRKNTQFWDPFATGYQLHLQVLHITLRAFMMGKLDRRALIALERAVRKEPNNALYQAALHRLTDKDQTKATKLLLATTRFPELALPTSSNQCTEYLWQRDEYGDDWRPCPDENRTHSGTDFLIAAAFVLGF